MNKINFLSLIGNAIFFIAISYTNATAIPTPTVFNPNSNEFKGKVVVAKTFATWCRYCRQKAIRELELRQIPQIGENMQTTDRSINLFLVPADNYEESAQFFDDIGFRAKIQIINPQKLENWGVNNFGAVLIFNDAQLVKMVDGEVDLVVQE